MWISKKYTYIENMLAHRFKTAQKHLETLLRCSKHYQTICYLRSIVQCALMLHIVT